MTTDKFTPDPALIPLMSEAEQLRLDVHPTHVLFGGYAVPRRDIRIGERVANPWPRSETKDQA